MNRADLDFCLLIPCYNNVDGLVRSLNSIEYMAERYLVVVVDDGSDERIDEVKLAGLLATAKPVKVLVNRKNLGITGALNVGLEWICGNTSAKYIARLDCGDLCMPERFSLQVSYLDANPEVALLGSWCRFQDPRTGRGYDYITSTEYRRIRKEMHFRNVFMHPTVMFRRLVIPQTGYYPTEFPYAEDYAFFWKLTDVHVVHVLPCLLVICEINSTGLSYKHRQKQLRARWKVVKTFSRSSFLKILSFLRLSLLYILPKGLILRLKQLR